ncbi:hypothetical protein [Tropicimonas isoalkanivorans]|uniref:Uncharacterized protein n=1 Tax=Tropicimonas isoalkanivorans TaxID=441112 RepID=A0A1I1PXP3_9RHOB|nr:hypothetical protein [Tropicimonas isoalkanivorans]SFD14654.1 hypothetical protein SAMN04488094_11719 [Tropicimonas isoalkanivorans]
MKSLLIVAIAVSLCTPVLAQEESDKALDRAIPTLAPAPDGETLAERQENYVDPTRGRGRCAETRPDRPGWVMVHDKSEGPGAGAFAAIGQALYRLRSSENIMESGECSCGLLYPDWSSIRTEYETLIAEVMTVDLAVEAKDHLTSQKTEAYGRVRNLCKGVK